MREGRVRVGSVGAREGGGARERERETDDGLVVVHEVEEVAQVCVVALLLSVSALAVLSMRGEGEVGLWWRS